MSKKTIAPLETKARGEEVDMSAEAFRRWRKSLGLSQKEAAAALGLKRRIVQYYEKGERDGDPVDIPKTVRLACAALSHGVRDYAGPEGVGDGSDDPEPADADGAEDGQNGDSQDGGRDESRDGGGGADRAGYAAGNGHAAG